LPANRLILEVLIQTLPIPTLPIICDGN
jgi:hypothetical protein